MKRNNQINWFKVCYNWKKNRCIWKHIATFVALYALFLVASMTTKCFIFKLSNKQWFGVVCKDLLQKSSLNFFNNIFTMILLYIIVCLNLSTVITITVFYKFRKLNTHSTKKELKKSAMYSGRTYWPFFLFSQ